MVLPINDRYSPEPFRLTAQLLALGHGPKSCRVSLSEQCQLQVDGIVDFAALQNDSGTGISATDRIELLVDSGQENPVRLPAVIDTIKKETILVQCMDIETDKLKLMFSDNGVSSRDCVDGDVNKPELIGAIKRITKKNLDIIVEEFLCRLEEQFYAKAESALTDQVQQVYFETLSQLRGYEKLIVRRFQQAVLEQIDRCDGFSSMLKDSNDEQKIQGLSVIDKRDFEDWLAVKNVIVRVSQVHHIAFGYSYERYCQLMGVDLAEDSLPISVTFFCRALQHAVGELMHDREVVVTICDCFEEVIVAKLGDFYQEINEVFRTANLLPNLEEDTVNGLRPKERLRGHELKNKVSQQEQEANIEIDDSAESSCLSSSEQQPLTQEDAHRLYDTVKSIFSLRHSRQPANEGVRRDTGETSQLSTISDEEVLDTLSHLQSQQQPVNPLAAGVSLRSWLAQEVVGRGGKGGLGNDVLNRVDLVEGMFDSIINDHGVSDIAKPLLRQLTLPFLRMVLSDDSFLCDKNHPARELLNQLAILGSYSEISPAAIEKNLRSITQAITDEQAQDLDVYTNILNEVNKLISNQQNAHTRNAQRVAHAYAGQEELAQAKNTVRKELAKRLMGIKVPEVVLSLLDAGWRDLMIILMIKKGIKSKEWQESLRVIDQLLSWLGDEPNILANEKLAQSLDRDLESETFVQLINGELESGSPGHFKHVGVINELRRILCVNSMDKRDLCYVQLEKNDPFYGLSLPNKKNRRQGVEEAMHRWLDRAKCLEVGSWLGSVHLNERDADLRLAWVSVDKSKFVFVNRQGQMKAEYDLAELAEKMKNGWQVIDKSEEWSAVDRSLYGSLQTIYDELDFQRCHDELTGFYNRKEFERSLENCLFKTKREETAHVLCYVDLDKFRVVNDYCGVIAGDQLLQEIGSEIASVIPEHVVIARVAGNEFAMLFENCSESRGNEYARKIIEAVKKYRFEWQSQSYRLTASIGMAMLDQYIDDSVEAFKVLSASCRLAKEGGGNRIEWAKSSVSERQKHVDMLAWVTRIDRALDQDRLVLRCQKIHPIGIDNKAEAHYEILLGVLDDANDEVVLPPAKFIEAAEKHNRMQDVDRWVTTKVFEWIHANGAKMAELGGFSINLSGNSLNDEDFIDFISDRLCKFSVPADKICFEITETATISSLTKAVVFIREVKSMGFKFALDDFGTGMSSYEYLKHLPVDYLKIDGCFIKDVVSNSFDLAVVKSINEIGHFMGKKTIAEFVEDEDILALLTEIGVDFAQGYGVHKPTLLSLI